MKILTTNRKAYHEYEVLDTVEAGLVLLGTEIKALRSGKASLSDSYARIEDDEVFLYSMHVTPYDHGNRYNEDPRRTRKLLMHKQEIRRLHAKVKEKGLTLVPLKLYLKHNRAKIEIGLVRGKKIHDKRQALAKKDADRQKQIEQKENRKYM